MTENVLDYVQNFVAKHVTSIDYQKFIKANK